MTLMAKAELVVCSVETQATNPESFHCTNIPAFERIVRSSSFWASHCANVADQKEVLLMRDRLPAADWRKSRCDLLEKPPSGSRSRPIPSYVGLSSPAPMFACAIPAQARQVFPPRIRLAPHPASRQRVQQCVRAIQQSHDP